MTNNNVARSNISNNNDDNDNDNNRKRKERSYLPDDGVQNGPNKRLNVHRPASTPATGPPAQPKFGFGNPQMDSPAIYVPQQTTKAPDVAMDSTGVAPQYPQSQSQSQPQAQYPQQQPQHVPQAVEHQPGLNTKVTPGFPNMGLADVQQQMTPQKPVEPQHAGRSVQCEKKGSSIGLLGHQATEAYRSGIGGIPIEINATGSPGKGHFITTFPGSKNTISIASGSKGWETIAAQYAYHSKMYGGHCRVEYRMITVPLMSSRLPNPHQPRQPSTSTENLIPTKTGARKQMPEKIPAQVQAQVQSQAQPPAPRPLMTDLLPPPNQGSLPSDSTENMFVDMNRPRRPKPRKPESQSQPPAQPPAQAHPQGQELIPCANCNRKGHLVGDCVGPPNKIHGDLPACPICDKFAGRVEGMTDPNGHRFDDCHHVKDIFHRHQWDISHRLTYSELAALTDDELLMLFRSLVVKRVRKVPIRTKLVCWIDVLRETVRRFHNTDVITPLGNMTPWTKTFSIHLQNPFFLNTKPWEFYDYTAGITQSLPAGSVEKALAAWEDFVAKGLPDFPAQVFVSSDRNYQVGE